MFSQAHKQRTGTSNPTTLLKPLLFATSKTLPSPLPKSKKTWKRQTNIKRRKMREFVVLVKFHEYFVQSWILSLISKFVPVYSWILFFLGCILFGASEERRPKRTKFLLLLFSFSFVSSQTLSFWCFSGGQKDIAEYKIYLFAVKHFTSLLNLAWLIKHIESCLIRTPFVLTKGAPIFCIGSHIWVPTKLLTPKNATKPVAIPTCSIIFSKRFG